MEMSLYVGISNETGKLVIGDMYEEVHIKENEKRVTISIFDYNTFDFHPVDACIKLLN